MFFLALLAVAVTAGFLAGIAINKRGKRAETRPDNGRSRKEAGTFNEQDRVGYRLALEKVRYELRAGPDAPPFEQAVKTEDIELALRLQDKKMRLLESYCGIKIDGNMIDREIERMKNDYQRPGLMLKIAEALDRDPAAIVEFWVKPILADRYLDACVLADPDINAGALAETRALREKIMAGQDHPPSVSADLDLGDPNLEADDRQALLGLEPGGLSEVVEGTFDFHFYRLLSRSGDTVEVEVFSTPKPDPAQWIEARP